MSRRGRATPGVDGLLVLAKPAGCTSHDCVNQVRRLYGQRRVGHAGTLDPGARGVLVLALGLATRLLEFLGGCDKAYRGEIVFGVTTASDDDQGDVVNMVNAAGLTAAAVRAALPALCGEIAQRAPAVSAKQVGGRRLYDLQRRGEAVEAPTALVRVDRLELTSFVGGEQAVAAVTVECGPGTYVRAIARDLGAALGVGAHLRALVRTRVGPYGLDDAVTPETLAALSPDERLARLVPPETAVAHLPALTVPAALREDLRCGRVLALTAAAAADAVALLGEDGRLLAIGEPASGGIHPRKVFV